MFPPRAHDGTGDREANLSLPTRPVGPKPARTRRPLQETRARVRRPRGHECPRDVARARTSNPRPRPPHRARHRPPGLATGAHPSLTPPTSGPKPSDHWRSLRARPAAHPVGGATPCTSALAAELPPPRASCCETEAPRHPTRGLGKSAEASTVDPREPVDVSPTATGTADPSSAAIPGPRCCHRIPMTGFRRNRWLPPVSPQVTAGHGKAPHLRACPPDGPREDHGRSRDPHPYTPRACASIGRTAPPVLLGTSSRQAHLIHILQTDRPGVAADATSSSDPRFVAESEPRCRSVRVPPNRSELQLGGGRREHRGARAPHRSEVTREALTWCPDTLDAMFPPRGCTTWAQTRSTRRPPRGRTRTANREPYRRRSARSCPARAS